MPTPNTIGMFFEYSHLPFPIEYISQNQANNNVTDSWVNSSTVADINITAGGNLTLANVTRTDGNATFTSSSGLLTVRFYLEVNVTNTSNDAVTAANVNVKNVSGTLVVNITTGAANVLNKTNVTYYTQTQSGVIHHGNITLNVTKFNYTGNYSSRNVSTNLKLQIIIAGSSTPALSGIQFQGVTTTIICAVEPCDYVYDSQNRVTLYRLDPNSQVYTGAIASGVGLAEIALRYTDINLTYGGQCIRGRDSTNTIVYVRKIAVINNKPVVAIDFC